MKSLLLIITVITSTISWSASFEEANKLLEEKKYEEAIALYEVYLKEHNDISAYYNLGLAYHSNNQHAHAAWAFQKALKLNPLDDKALEQYKLCQNEIDASLDAQPILGAFESSLYGISSTIWSVLSIIMVLLLSIALFGSFRFIQKRKIFTLISISSAVFAIAFIIIASKTANYEQREFAFAIAESLVLDKKAYTPTKKIILEGERFEIIERIDSTYLVIQDQVGIQEIVSAKDFKSL